MENTARELMRNYVNSQKFSCGMSQRDIAEQIQSLYDVEISPELVSKISEKIMPEVTAWQNRPLEQVYPFVFMDAMQTG